MYIIYIYDTYIHQIQPFAFASSSIIIRQNDPFYYLTEDMYGTFIYNTLSVIRHTQTEYVRAYTTRIYMYTLMHYTSRAHRDSSRSRKLNENTI